MVGTTGVGLAGRRALLALGATLVASGGGRKLAAQEAGPALTVTRGPPVPAPEAQWTTADGTARTLADYAGQAVVLNFWATWCVPCVAEMPALDALAYIVSTEPIAVLALSSDRGGAKAVERFYAERGVRNLAVLLDPRGTAARAFGSKGIPTTVLLDRAGQERARVEGAVDWALPASVTRLREIVG